MNQKYILLIFTLCFILYSNGFSQKASFNYESLLFSDILEDLSHQLNVTFAYETSELNELIVSAKGDQLSLKQALEKIIVNYDINFHILNDEYVVLRREIQNETVISNFVVGRLLDAIDHTPLAYATIFNITTEDYTVANEQGKFRVPHSGKGSDSIIIQYLGYEKLSINVPVSQGLDLELERIEQIIDEVQVVDKSISLLNAAVNGNGYLMVDVEIEIENGNGYLMNPNKIRALPGFGETDVFRLAQLLPGIRADDESATALSVRGGTPDQNLVIYDGIKIYHQGHFFGMQSSFNPNIVNSFKIYKSGFSSKYGGRISGIVDIESSPISIQKFRGMGGVNLLDVNFSISAPLFKNKTMLMIAGRRSYTDIINTVFYKKLFQRVASNSKIGSDQDTTLNDTETLESNPKFYYADLNAKLLIEPSLNTNGYISFIFARDKLFYISGVSATEDDSFNYESNDNLDTRNFGVGLFLNHKWNIKHQSEIKVAVSQYKSRYQFEINGGDFDDSFAESQFKNNGLLDYNISLNHTTLANKYFSLTSGYEFTFYKTEYAFELQTLVNDDDDGFNSNEKSSIHTFFIDYSIFPTDFIVINSGARFNYYNLSKHFFWEPRINVTFQPGKKYWSIKASIGSYKQVIHQLIEGNELGLGNELWAVSNLEDDIPVSSARQLNFGVNYKKENFLFDIQFFNKKISDIKFLETDGYGNLSDGFDIGSGNVNGIELLVKQKWRDKYGIWLAYSFSKSINQSEGIDSDMSFNADNDVPHSLKLVTSYNNQNWECSVLWSCESGQVYTPAINLQLINDGDDLDYVIQYENRNSKRLKPFHRLDLSANYNWLPKNRSIVVKFGTSILNVYNRNKSTDVKYVIIDEEDQEIRRFDRTQIGIVPNFFIKVEF